jgi:hypothetical protein
MNVLKLSENLDIEIQDELLEVEDFKEIIKRTRVGRTDNDGRKKLIAKKELAYVYHMSAPKSPYYNYAEEERKIKLKEALFSEVDKEWKPDKVIEKAIATYREIHKTPSMHSLDSMLNALHDCTDIVIAVTEQLKVDLKNGKHKTGINNKKGQIVSGTELMLNDLTALLKVSKEIPNHIDGLEKLYEKLQSEQMKVASKVRGGVMISARER